MRSLEGGVAHKMNFYKSISTILSPIIRCYVYAVRGKIYKKEDVDINRFQERFGNYSRCKRLVNKPIWIHASSIGESMTALDILNKINKSDIMHKYNIKKQDVLLTVGTSGARTAIENKYSKSTIVSASDNNNEKWKKKQQQIKLNFQFQCIYLPIDVTHCVRLFFEHWKPSCGIFFESELWPALINEAKERNIPLSLLNATLSEKSYQRWSKYTMGKQIFASMISNFNTIQCQTDQDMAKFVGLGADENKIKVFGNVKLLADGSKYISDENVNDVEEGTKKMPPSSSFFELERTIMNELFLFNSNDNRETHTFIVVAGSTYLEDEEMIVNFHKLLVSKFSAQMECEQKKIMTIIAPRKIHRINDIENLVRKNNLKCVLWSSIVKDVPLVNIDDNASSKYDGVDVILIDKFGILQFFYEHGNIIYVGGALTKKSVGGHNFMEAINNKGNKEAIVCTGSHLADNMESLIDILRQHNCIVPFRVNNHQDMYKVLLETLENTNNVNTTGKKQNTLKFFKQNLLHAVVNDLLLNKVLREK